MLSPYRKDRNIEPIDESIPDQALTRGQFETAFGQLEDKLERLTSTLLTRLDGTPESVFSAAEPVAGTSSPLSMTPSRPRAIQHHKKQRVDIPQTILAIPASKNWETCVRHWNQGIPENGTRPLKSWSVRERSPPGTDRGAVKALFSVRKLLGEEFNTLGEEQFRQQYSSFLDGNLNALYEAIRANKRARAQTKGSSNTRRSQSSEQ